MDELTMSITCPFLQPGANKPEQVTTDSDRCRKGLDKKRRVLTTGNNFRQVLTSTANFLHDLTGSDKFLQVLTSSNKFLQILTSFDKFKISAY